MNIKNIKHEIRDRLPDILYSICWQRKNLLKVFCQRKTIKILNKRKRDYPKPKIVFFLQFPEVWNSFKTIYEAALRDGAETLVLCAKKPVVNGAFEKGLQKANEAFEFCNEEGIHAINAFDEDSNAWYDLESYSPDYVFYARPYNHEIPPLYRSFEVTKYAKICQVNYGADTGVNILGGWTTMSPDFTPYVYCRFLASERWIEPYRRCYALQLILKMSEVKMSGTPRYDLVIQQKREADDLSYTIAWLPRWVMKDTVDNYRSHFLEYINNFISYMQSHSTVKLIIRPHPLMWAEIVNAGMMTEDEVCDLKRQIGAVENVYIDYCKDYIDTLSKADILVADYTSLIIEYYVSGNPIIYCGSTPLGVTSKTEKIFDSMYVTDSWEEVKKYLDMLLDGDDEKKGERKNMIDEIIPSNAGHIGNDIYQWLLEDFKKYHKKEND